MTFKNSNNLIYINIKKNNILYLCTAVVILFSIPILIQFNTNFLVSQSAQQISNKIVLDISIAKFISILRPKSIIIESKNDKDWSTGWYIYIDHDQNLQFSQNDTRIITTHLDENKIKISASSNKIPFNSLSLHKFDPIIINIKSQYPDIDANFINVYLWDSHISIQYY